MLWLVAFSLSAATAPPHRNTDSARVQAQRPRGAVEELGQNGVTITVTTSLPPTTIYINPSTTVLTETRGTSTVWAGITILSKSWGCYIDSYINPPWLETRSAFDPRETTVTFEQRNTVFVTLTGSPPRHAPQGDADRGHGVHAADRSQLRVHKHQVRVVRDPLHGHHDLHQPARPDSGDEV